MKIGITGSISSGKSTVTQMITKRGEAIFNADNEVQKLYSSQKIQKKIFKKFKINRKNFKKILKRKIINNQISLKKLGKLIHPYVRTNMKKFLKKHNKKKNLFFEIPLLVESKLMKYFDIIILVIAPKNKRANRFCKKGGDILLFNILDNHQLKPKEKKKYSNFVIVNNQSIKSLKIKVKNVMSKLKL
tara:strand:+ start:196 stop:759 length:564 start_codon:yes stop_codon:yes gene_type:complete